MPTDAPADISAADEDDRFLEFTPEFLAYARSAVIALVGCAVMACAGASLGGYLDPGLGYADAPDAVADAGT